MKFLLEHILYIKKQTKYSLTNVLKIYKLASSTYYRLLKVKEESKVLVKRNNAKALLKEELKEVLKLRKQHREVGYRKFSHMLEDYGIYLSESCVYRILKEYDLLGPWSTVGKEADKEYKNKPKHPHDHWHIDISYIKISGVFYFLIMALDGYSRYLLGWELMTDMTTDSVIDFVHSLKDKYPHAKPKVITDNGTQFISRDFKQMCQRLQFSNVYTRRNHPQTNGKIERAIKSVKTEAIRPKSPDSYKEAVKVLEEYQYTYNHNRLHAAIDFLRPSDVFCGRKDKLLEDRKRNLKEARKNRIQINKERFAKSA